MSIDGRGGTGSHLGPGPRTMMGGARREPRSWWFTDHMRLGLVQFFAAVGGGILPIYILIQAAPPARRPWPAVLALILLGLGVYSFVQTRFLTEVAIAGDEARLAAGTVTVAGILVTLLVLIFVAAIAVILFFLLWPLMLTHARDLLAGLVRVLFRAVRRMFGGND